MLRQVSTRQFRPALGTLVLALVLLLSACGNGGSGATQGTLTGDVEAGPTCPTVRVSQTCPPAPVANRQVQILMTNGSVAATTTTDTRGHFSIGLAPGSYFVKVAIVSGQVGRRQTTPGNVTIVAGQTAYLKIELDTGIR